MGNCFGEFKDLKGKVFGKWTVLSFHGKSRHKQSIWNCRCECSHLQQVIRSALRLNSNNCEKCGFFREHSQEYMKEVFASNNWYRYRIRAHQRGYSFLLSKETFISLIFSNCFYCFYKGTKKNVRNSLGKIGEVICNGIDRVDNNYGYFDTNCVPCCETCNYAKSSMSQSDFEAYLDRITFARLKRNPHKFYHILEKPFSTRVA